MANPIQQGLKLHRSVSGFCPGRAAMANPIQQGLKLRRLAGSGDVITGRNG